MLSGGLLRRTHVPSTPFACSSLLVWTIQHKTQEDARGAWVHSYTPDAAPQSQGLPAKCLDASTHAHFAVLLLEGMFEGRIYLCLLSRSAGFEPDLSKLCWKGKGVCIGSATSRFSKGHFILPSFHLLIIEADLADQVAVSRK